MIVVAPSLDCPRLVGLRVKLLRISRAYRYAGILAFASPGSFAVDADPLDLELLMVLGLLGFVMRRYGWPVAPDVIGDALVDEDFVQGDALRRLHEELPASGVPFEVRQPVRGRDVAEELSAVVTETAAELLVIGVRRRTPVGTLLMGSAAQRIPLEVDCPILAVKSPPRTS